MSVATIVITATRANAPATTIINRGPTGPAGPSGPAGSNSITSATTSDGTADINFNQVGIGTTSPSYKLHVNGNVWGNTFYTNLFSVGNEGKVVSTSTQGLQLQAVAGSKPITFYTNVGGNTERMRITHDGNVGIGTNSPAAKLHVSGSLGSGIDGADKTGIRLTNTPYGLTWRIGSGSGGVSHSRFTIARAGQLPALTIDNSDKVGIGTTGPSQKLDVDGAVKKAVFTVNTLPTATAGTSCYVSDSNHTHHSNVGQVVASGGSNFVPVYYDGNDWRIG